MARLKQPAADCLDPRDLILAVHGPWHVQAGCQGNPTPLWDPRVRPGYLRPLWAKHQAAIEQAAAEAGVAEAWIESRLAFCAALDA